MGGRVPCPGKVSGSCDSGLDTGGNETHKDTLSPQVPRNRALGPCPTNPTLRVQSNIFPPRTWGGWMLGRYREGHTASGEVEVGRLHGVGPSTGRYEEYPAQTTGYWGGAPRLSALDPHSSLDWGRVEGPPSRPSTRGKGPLPGRSRLSTSPEPNRRSRGSLGGRGPRKDVSWTVPVLSHPDGTWDLSLRVRGTLT